MANIIYNVWHENQAKKLYAWDSATTVKALLVRSTSTYSPDKDHTTIQQMKNNGLVEISASGYSRATANNKTVYVDTNNDIVQYRCDNLTFGTPASGQTVIAVVLYVDLGNDNSSFPIAYIDQAGNDLPMNTGNGTFTVNVPSSGILQIRQGTA